MAHDSIAVKYFTFLQLKTIKINAQSILLLIELIELIELILFNFYLLLLRPLSLPLPL